VPPCTSELHLSTASAVADPRGSARTFIRCNNHQVCAISFLKPFALAEKLAATGSNTKFEALGNSPCPLYEMLRSRRRAYFAAGLLEQCKPAIEMRGIDRKRDMHEHRIAVVATRHKRNRRPEGTHAMRKLVLRMPLYAIRLLV
jgi:hypothetical protein